MGLGGRKVKQRIGNDPRNLSWADDAARFGQNYLSKFGWDASKGLGAEGEGRISALKVAQKLDMLGIGAAHQKDPNGIAWKQNKDFENLLRRLNAANGDEEVKTNVSGFSQAVETNLEGATNGVASMMVVEAKEEPTMEVDEGETKNKSKKEKKSKKDKEGKRKRFEEEDEEKDVKKPRTVEESPTPPVEAEAPPKRSFVPRHRAHRARAIAAKSISSKSSVHISEILGIAPDNSVLVSLNSAPSKDQGKLTVINSENGPTLEKLTTSTKSVADYFKEKLAAKVGGSSASSSGLGASREESEEEDRPRGGLGMGFARVSWESSQQQVKTEMADGESLRVGLSKFSSLMSSTFLTGTMESGPSSSSTPQTEEAQDSDGESRQDEKRQRKRLKKEEKLKRRAEKEKRRAEKAAATVASDDEGVSETKKSKKRKRKAEDIIDSVPQREKKEKKRSTDKTQRIEEPAEVGASKKKKSKKDSDS